LASWIQTAIAVVVRIAVMLPYKGMQSDATMTAPMRRSCVTLDLPAELIAFCDEQAKQLCLSRSAFIRFLVITHRQSITAIQQPRH